MNNGAFISYRRDVSAFMARAVFQDLRTNGVDVFMDVQSIDSGQFGSIILDQIAARPYFLIILTPGALDRCNEPGDWLRREIEHAIDLKRIIIPLITPNFSFAAVQPYLTGKLDVLPHFNAVEIPHSYFEEAMERLRKRFLKPVDLTTTPVPQPKVVEWETVQQRIKSAVEEVMVTERQLNAQNYFERALARPQDDLDGKVADYTEAIKLVPDFAQAFYNRALVRQRQRDMNGARADLTETIRLEPNDIAYYVRGNMQDNVDDAIADYSAAIKINPRNVPALAKRGFAFRTKGDIEGMLADLKRAIELKPDDALTPLMRNYIDKHGK